jgi:hypothetical protein
VVKYENPTVNPQKLAVKPENLAVNLQKPTVKPENQGKRPARKQYKPSLTLDLRQRMGVKTHPVSSFTFF